MDLAQWGIWGTVVMTILRLVESIIATQKNDRAKGIIAIIKEFFHLG